MGRFKGFLTGGILGMIAGVLMAPKKGEETRQQLKEESEIIYCQHIVKSSL